MRTGATEGLRNDEFEEIHAGRRLVLEYAITSCSKIAVVVLDSASISEDELVIACAAMLVPYGRESEWVYSSEGGQWQLLTSAGVSRLILLSRIPDTSPGDFSTVAPRSLSGDEKQGRALKRSQSAEEYGGGWTEGERLQLGSEESLQVLKKGDLGKEKEVNLRKLRLAGECVDRQTLAVELRTKKSFLEHNGEESTKLKRLRLRECVGGQIEEERTDVGSNVIVLEQRGEHSRAEISAVQVKGECMVKSSLHQAKKVKKLQLKNKQLHNETPGSRSARTENRFPEVPIDSRERPFPPSVRSFEDEALKCMLGSLVVALAPSGVPNIPFVTYSDNVVRRVVVEEAFSALTGLMRVEDVELETDNNEGNEHVDIIQENGSSKGPPEVQVSSQIMPCCDHKVIEMRYWRRRLIFRRMPNLIQTEVVLNLDHAGDRRTDNSNYGMNGDGDVNMLKNPKKSTSSSQPQLRPFTPEAAVWQVDHSRLVHKYLPPIVAGFVLIASCLDACLASEVRRAHILSVGLGGGALPIFLQKHFSFHIQVIDLDKEVLNLAKKHFGLSEDVNFQVTVGDGLVVVEDIAARAIEEGVVDDALMESWKQISSSRSSAGLLSTCRDVILESGREEDPLQDCSKIPSSDVWKGFPASCNQEIPYQWQDRVHLSSSSKKPIFSESEHLPNDPRFELIIVDVDVGDPQLGLSSPPLSFLEQRFLISARVALQEGGMLVVNVVPFGKKSYAVAIEALKAVFAEVYEIAMEDDVNRIVFALPTPVFFNYHLAQGQTVDQVKKVVGNRFIQNIRRLDNNT